jgi:hypothetical protein
MTIPDDLEQALGEYQRDLEVQPALSAVMQAALREYLRQRGYLAPDEAANAGSQSSKPWPRYPLYSGDPELAKNDEEALAGAPDSPAFGER